LRRRRRASGAGFFPARRGWADRAFQRGGVRGEPVLGRVDDARLLAGGHGFRSGVEACARFHLDEHENAQPTRDDVDLAQRRLETARENAIALGEEKGRRPALRRQAEAQRRLPFRLSLLAAR
jgi:hypothetical protein